MVALGGWLPDFWMRCSSKPWNSGKLRDMFEICWATNLNHQLTIAWYMRGVFPWLELFAPGTWISILSLILIVALMVHSPASYIRTTPGHVYTCEGVSRYHSHAMPKKKYGHCALSCWGSAWNRPSPTIALYDKDAYELCYVYPSKPLLPPCIGHDSGLDIYYKTFKDNLFQTYSSTFQEVPMLYLNSEGRWNMMGFGDLTPGRNPVFLCRHPLENSDVELSCVCWIRSRMQVSKTPRRIDGDNPKSSARSARLVFFLGGTPCWFIRFKHRTLKSPHDADKNWSFKISTMKFSLEDGSWHPNQRIAGSFGRRSKTIPGRLQMLSGSVGLWCFGWNIYNPRVPDPFQK